MLPSRRAHVIFEKQNPAPHHYQNNWRCRRPNLCRRPRRHRLAYPDGPAQAVGIEKPSAYIHLCRRPPSAKLSRRRCEKYAYGGRRHRGARRHRTWARLPGRKRPFDGVSLRRRANGGRRHSPHVIDPRRPPRHRSASLAGPWGGKSMPTAWPSA